MKIKSNRFVIFAVLAYGLLCASVNAGTLSIQSVRQVEADTFEIEIKGKASVDPSKVLARLYVYDLKDGKAHLIDGQPYYKWSNPAPTWKQGNETLTISYKRVPDPARNYYGYVARVFYRGKLEDVKASKRDLVALAP